MTPVAPDDGGAADPYRHNRAFWDEVTPVHVASDFYRVDDFKRGANVLHDFVVREVGDVSGLSLLHLQCHFGLDTLCWARLGARVTGADISGASIEQARALAAETGTPATFIQANVLELGDRFRASFDRVFTSFGALCWIGDLQAWAGVIAASLRPAGVFYIAEFHPVMDALQQSRPIGENADAYPEYPYFGEGTPLRFDPQGDDSDYADPSFTSSETTFEWYHPVSEVIGSLIDSGLAIEEFREHPFAAYPSRRGMVPAGQGLWRLPDGVVQLPLMYSIRARKPSA